MKRLIGMLDTNPTVHASKNLPFMVHTLNTGARPLIAALVNNIWNSAAPEKDLAILLGELKGMAETQLKYLMRNVVLTIPVSFSRFQLKQIWRSCDMASLCVLRLIHEPTVIALL